MGKIIGIFLATFVVAAGLAPGKANAVPIPGPDTFGYTGAEIDPNLRTLDSPTELFLDDDEVSGGIAIGFDFDFYGTTFTELFVSSNGFLTFDSGSGSGCCSGDTIPTPGDPDNAILGFHTDIEADAGGSIFHELLGTPGSREFVVSFEDVPFFFASGVANFQAILHEGTNDIELQYGFLSHDQDDEGSVSAGIENATGTDGLSILSAEEVDATINGLADRGFCFDHPSNGNLPATTSLCGASVVDTVVPAPEPASLAIFGAGLAGLGFLRRRLKKAA